MHDTRNGSHKQIKFKMQTQKSVKYTYPLIQNSKK